MIGAWAVFVGILEWKLCVISTPAVAPALPKQWHDQIYSLDEDETMRFIPPPFTPKRMKDPALRLVGQFGFVLRGKNQIDGINRAIRKPHQQWWELIHGPFSWSEQQGGTLATFRDVRAAIEFAAIGYWPDVIVSDELGSIPVDGDFIVRGDAPLLQRLAALQSILDIVTGRDLVIESQPVKREVGENWSLRLDNHEPLKLIKDWQLEPGIVMRENKEHLPQGAQR